MNMAIPTEETIAAIATAIAPGQGGIAVVRISGKAALATGQRVVTVQGKKPWESHTILYGHVMDEKGKPIVQGLLAKGGPPKFREGQVLGKYTGKTWGTYAKNTDWHTNGWP